MKNCTKERTRKITKVASLRILPESLIIVDGEDIIVDAELVANRLRVPAEWLKIAMRHGVVTTLVEKGVVEDQGRTRLTFRFRKRSWRVVIENDGSALEYEHPSRRLR